MDILYPMTRLGGIADLEPFDRSEWIVGAHPAADLLHRPTQLTVIVALSPNISRFDPVSPTTVAALPIHVSDGFIPPLPQTITRLARAAIWLWWGYYRDVWLPAELLRSAQREAARKELGNNVIVLRSDPS